MKSYKLLAVLCLLPFITFAQNQLDIGLLLGYSNYLGDLVPPVFTFNHSNVSFGVVGRKQMTKEFSLRSNLIFAKIEGDDAYYNRNTIRNTKFKGDIVEFSFMGEYDPYEKRRHPKEGGFAKTMSPYVFLGLGLTYANPKVVYGNPDNPDARAINNELHISLPIGVGVKNDITDQLFIGVEWGARFTTTDYLDGVSITGDEKNNDVYLIGGVTLGYRID